MEPQQDAETPQPRNWALLGGLALSLVIVVAVELLAGGTWPSRRGRGHGNEAAAIGALKTIGTSQSLFREADKDGDSTLDYGSLTELSDQQLVDAILGQGTKQGYTFRAFASPTTSEFLWAATANPAVPQVTGDRYFATNHEGVTFYTTAGPIPIDPKTCAIPPGPYPLGR